jgi:PAT family beta-lactamase induction signal transducer AmpG
VFTWLAFAGTNYWALTAAIIAENFTGAIGTVIFVAYLSALCKNPLHTATQFALLSALSAVGRTYLSPARATSRSGAAGRCSSSISTLVALPSFALLAWLQARGISTRSASRPWWRRRTTQNNVLCRIACDSVPSSR